MRELLMLRHGVTEANERKVFTGAADIPLSESGRRALAPLRGTYPAAQTFFTSGMRRAVETLALLYGETNHTDIPELSEYRFGEFEGRSHEALYAAEPLYRAWLAPDGVDVICPGGESLRMFDARVREGWQKLLTFRWTGLAVLVSHGGVLMSILRQFVPNGGVLPPPENAGGYSARITDGGDIAACERFS